MLSSLVKSSFLISYNSTYLSMANEGPCALRCLLTNVRLLYCCVITNPNYRGILNLVFEIFCNLVQTSFSNLITWPVHVHCSSQSGQLTISWMCDKMEKLKQNNTESGVRGCRSSHIFDVHDRWLCASYLTSLLLGFLICTTRRRFLRSLPAPYLLVCSFFFFKLVIGS